MSNRELTLRAEGRCVCSRPLKADGLTRCERCRLKYARQRGYREGARVEREAGDKRVVEMGKHLAMMTGSFVSGVLADLGLVSTGEEVCRLLRAGEFVEANQLAVRAIEEKMGRRDQTEALQ
ncbi:MAG: hypothetical protein ACYDH4_09505 [Candidatus Cryosericum sp.]